MKYILILALFINILIADAFSLNNDDINIINNSYDRNKIIKRIYNFEDFFYKVQYFDEIKKLNRVNNYINRIIGKADQTNEWVTPKEFLIKGRGDCEDYAMTKYFALQKLDIDTSKLYMAVVKVRGSRNYHMVLLYHKNNEFLVLDNLSWKLVPLRKRRNLKLFFAFDENGSYVLKNNRLIKEKGIRRGEIKHFRKMLKDVKEGR